MEMVAVIAALRACRPNTTIRLYTDSEYVVKGVAGEYELKANLDLWELMTKTLAAAKGERGKISITHLPRNSTPEMTWCDLQAKRYTDPKEVGPDFLPLGTQPVELRKEPVDKGGKTR